MTRIRQQNVTAAQWSSNGEALGALDLTLPEELDRRCPECGLRLVQTGYVMNYALGILLGAVAVVAYLLARR